MWVIGYHLLGYHEYMYKEILGEQFWTFIKLRLYFGESSKMDWKSIPCKIYKFREKNKNWVESP